MREILFRAKSAIIGAAPENSMWVQGDLVHIDDTTYINVDKLLVRVDPETVSQYIGINDRNGTKIFENDIVRGPDGSIVFILFDRMQFWAIMSNNRPTGFMVMERATVIGNIHDNPELLERSET